MNAPLIRLDFLNPRLRVVKGGSVRSVASKKKTAKGGAKKVETTKQPAWLAARDAYVACSVIAHEERTPDAVEELEQSRAVLEFLAKRAGQDPSTWTWRESPKLGQEPRVDALLALLRKCEEGHELLCQLLESDNGPEQTSKASSLIANVLCDWLENAGLSMVMHKAKRDWLTKKLRGHNWSDTESIARLALRAVGYAPKEAWSILNTAIESPRAQSPEPPQKPRAKRDKSKLGAK